jgi:alpha 1,3-glucosidase
VIKGGQQLIHPSSVSVKKENFKTCDQSGFCKRNRAYADTASSNSNFESPYKLDSTSLKLDGGVLTGNVLKALSPSENVRLPLTVAFLESGVARVTMDEEKRQKGEIELRHGSKARKERYNEAEKWAIVGGTKVSTGAAISEADDSITRIVYGPESRFEVIITHSPLGLEFKRDGETQIKFNDR